MQLKRDEKGKAYCELTDKEAEKLYHSNGKVKLYIKGNGVKAIPPPDCEHDLKIEIATPRKIRYCTKCIFWEFTNLGE